MDFSKKLSTLQQQKNDIKKQIDVLTQKEAAINTVIDALSSMENIDKQYRIFHKRKPMSDETKKKMSIVQTKRWAKCKKKK